MLPDNTFTADKKNVSNLKIPNFPDCNALRPVAITSITKEHSTPIYNIGKTRENLSTRAPRG